MHLEMISAFSRRRRQLIQKKTTTTFNLNNHISGTICELIYVVTSSYRSLR